jgi:Rrf2 family protein
VRISAKADYAVCAVTALSRLEGTATAERIAEDSGLRRAGVVTSRRGADGGHMLALAPKDISVADVLRAVDGPLADVHGSAPEDMEYDEGLEVLRPLWIAVRSSLRSVLESVTIADLAAGRLPKRVERLTQDPGAWLRR